MRNYVSLWDISYCAKGLCLYASLRDMSSKPFTLWVKPLDHATEIYLTELKSKGLLPYMEIIEAGLDYSIPSARPWPYYCFTMASVVTKYVQDLVNDDVTYLDSDLYFFGDPEIAQNEIGDREVAITPHRFPEHDFARLSSNGLYNVSWVTFKNTDSGRFTLAGWTNQCIAKCDAESVGDQKYLDEWPDYLGKHLCVFQNIGIGVAPWNVGQYIVDYVGPESDRVVVDNEPVIFYHFHELKRIQGEQYKLTGYPLRPEVKSIIYEPYLNNLIFWQDKIDKGITC